MGQNQSQSSTNKTLKQKRTIKAKSNPSQVSTDSGAFTVPWDLRDGGTGNGPSNISPVESPETEPKDVHSK